jgi:N-acetylmuramoyl-L-alanine amidase
MKQCFQIGWISVVLCWFFVGVIEAGTVEVSFSDQNLQYTLFTLYHEQNEFVQLDKVSEMFRLDQEIDPIDGRVVLRYGDKSASFFPGQGTVIADRRSHFLRVAPLKIDEVIMVPLQFLTTILPLIYEQDILWDPENKKFWVGVHDLEISNLYSSPYGEYTRIFVEMNQAISYRVTEKLPSLLIFELPYSTFQLTHNPLQINSRSVRHVKVIDSFGSTQIIVRLGQEFVRYTHQVTDNPSRLIIDVYNTQRSVVETQRSEDIREEDLSAQSGPMMFPVPRQFVLRTVVVDPGHGGSDAGIVVAPRTEDLPDLLEKQITLQIAKMLETSLIQRFGGVRVVFTREGDDFVSAERRATIANSNRADAFISVHVNNDPSAVRSGFEIYVMDYGSLELPQGYDNVSAQSQFLDYAQAKYIEQSERLATQIIAAYEDRNSGKRGRLMRAPLFTLKGVTMPAIHVEIGYGSSEQDRLNIIQEEFQQVLVAAITDGLAMFVKEEGP